jgi:nucleoside recognition membrane protein YjiH
VRIENNTEKQLEENVEEKMHPERFSVEFGVQRIIFCSSIRSEFYHGQEGSMFCNSVVTSVVMLMYSSACC